MQEAAGLLKVVFGQDHELCEMLPCILGYGSLPIIQSSLERLTPAEAAMAGETSGDFPDGDVPHCLDGG